VSQAVYEHSFKYVSRPMPKVMLTTNEDHPKRVNDALESASSDSLMIFTRPLLTFAQALISRMITQRQLMGQRVPDEWVQALTPTNFEYYFDKLNGKLRCRFVAMDGEGHNNRIVVVMNKSASEDMWRKHVKVLKDLNAEIEIEEPQEMWTRYEKYEKVVFMRYNLQVPHATEFFTPFIPWEHMLESIDVKVLTCTEHHWVSGEWDYDPKHKGHIFVSEKDGTRWFNQYPTASYGQLSTDEDYRARAEHGSNTTPEHAVYEDVTAVIDRISRGIRKFKENATQYDIDPENKQRLLDYGTSLEEHLEDLIEFVQKQTECQIILEPLKIGRLDGTEEVYPEILKSRVSWLDETPVQPNV